MKITCDNCEDSFIRKASEVNPKQNFCSKQCWYDFKEKNIDKSHRSIMIFFKSRWTLINIRCGIYKNEDNSSPKNLSYKNISITFSREEFKDFCFNNYEKILSQKKPSIDRIDPDKDYSLDNIDIIELSENIKKKRPGNKYITNGFGLKRGIRKVGEKFSCRIWNNGKEKHIGMFINEEDANNEYRKEYIKIHNKEPW